MHVSLTLRVFFVIYISFKEESASNTDKTVDLITFDLNIQNDSLIHTLYKSPYQSAYNGISSFTSSIYMFKVRLRRKLYKNIIIRVMKQL